MEQDKVIKKNICVSFLTKEQYDELVGYMQFMDSELAMLAWESTLPDYYAERWIDRRAEAVDKFFAGELI